MTRQSAEKRKNPWLSLSRKREAGGAIPVVLDQNTAMYSLHLYGGVGEEFEIDSPRGGKIKLQVVGLLANSIFQGDLIVSEENFERLFPDVSGYRLFLVTAPPADIKQVADALDSALGDYGFSAQTTAARLETFFAVQNTYLSTFRSLGGLGLLLGTIGLAAAQLRSVVERRGELALMQACGFRRRRLSQMILLENAALAAGRTSDRRARSIGRVDPAFNRRRRRHSLAVAGRDAGNRFVGRAAGRRQPPPAQSCAVRWCRPCAAADHACRMPFATVVRHAKLMRPADFPSTHRHRIMKNTVLVLLSIGLVMLSWGAYGNLLGAGTRAMGNPADPAVGVSHFLPFIFVGVAYFLIAVLAAWGFLVWRGEPGHWSTTGVIWSFLAGAVTAVGALGVILALVNRGNAIYVMPLIFGGARW